MGKPPKDKLQKEHQTHEKPIHPQPMDSINESTPTVVPKINKTHGFARWFVFGIIFDRVIR